jgi:NAD(P)-dependent dehydrogenase (short-subunit alcohol dehydrogenase family)
MITELTSSASVAFVTGAASGIGRACARTFVKEGCTRLILGDLGGDLEDVAQELIGVNAAVRTVLVKADVSSLDDVERMVAEGVKQFGAIHYAVNCAGITSNPRVRTHEMPTESWDRVNDVNIRGLWFCQRAQIQQMMKQPVDLTMRCGPYPN